ncbi:hypothetical protein A4U64_26775 (plasmid) [Rhodococcus sp. WB1]|uniref:hypothetical protein n=1 Tax=Rhodococcus sp. WB1 TaxID=1033922 RepID=UPI00081A8059|nr:hypothetical protein [Rhodococcus sp. WB1]ANZ28498.1 hypothetical protein A4U64_26775 [Rhodococcus sp. WB1]
MTVDDPGADSATADADTKNRVLHGAESTSDPDTVLEQLRKQVADAKSKADTLSAEIKALTPAIEALTKYRGDIDKADADYARVDHPKAIATTRRFAEDKLACIETTLGSQLPTARQLVQELATEIDQVSNELHEAESRLQTDTQKAESANRQLTEASKSLSERLSLPKAFEGPVRALATLQSTLKASIDKDDAFGAFANYSEIVRQADELENLLPALDAYRDLLTDDWNEVSDAQQKVREANESVAKSQRAVDRLRASYTALTTDRVAELQRRWNTSVRSSE